jgi:hypothetical protein
VLSRHHLAPQSIQLAPIPGHVRLYVLGNAEDLRTAVLNLLDNAVKYSPGGVHIRCRIGIERYTNVVLSVTDTGLGLPRASSSASSSASTAPPPPTRSRSRAPASACFWCAPSPCSTAAASAR